MPTPNKLTLTPLGNRIIVAKPPKPEPKTSGGILLTENETPEAEHIAEVLAIGDTVEAVTVGDEVLYPTYGYTEITEDGTDYLIIDVADLLAKRVK